jgi:carboxypeptidase T
VITQVGAPKTFTTLMLLSEATDSVSYTLSPDLAIGSQFRFLLQVNNGFYTHSDTITKYFGPPLVVFLDSCNDFSNWTSPKWNFTQSHYYSPPGSITDSPNGNYSNNENNTITLKNAIDLLDSPVAAIEYMARWNTEQGFDYVQVKASGGAAYAPLTGKYTHPGGDNEPQGQPVYDGLKADWVPEQIVTTAYVNKDISLRFTLTSDTWTTFDGFYFDDLKVTIIDMSSVGVENLKGEAAWVSNPVPNPAGGVVRVSYRLPESFNGHGDFLLYDLNGSVVKRFPVNSRAGTLSFDVSCLTQGLYYYRIEAAGMATGVKKLVVVR